MDFTSAAHNVTPTQNTTFMVSWVSNAPPAPTWSDQTLGAMTVGVAYSDGVSATNTTSYAIVAGTVPTGATAGLPPGLTLNTSTGAITGTPTTSGPYAFAIQASGGGGSITTSTFTMFVAGGLWVWTGTLAGSFNLQGYVNGTATVWNGTSWVVCPVYIWNGTSWVVSL
jgi:hypothetical protein